MGTKNNPKNRGISGGKKKLNGKDIEPAYYYGAAAGHSNYMSAKIAKSNELIMNEETGKPLVWDEIVGDSSEQ